MQRLTAILKALALATVPALGAFLIWTLWPVRAAILGAQAQTAVLAQHADAAFEMAIGTLDESATQIGATGARVSRTLGGIDRETAALGPVLGNLAADEAKLGGSLDAVNRACIPGPCGTLADVAKTLNTVRGTFGQIEIAANHEDRNLSTLDAQENQLFEDFHGTATRANTSLDRFNTLLANPNIALMLGSGAHILSTTDQVTTKLAQCTLHPHAACYFKNDALFAAQVGGYLLR